jgi:hypothetical protein
VLTQEVDIATHNAGNDPMMPPRVIMDHAFAEPFRPFRIHTASGQTFEVRYPDIVQMAQTF